MGLPIKLPNVVAGGPNAPANPDETANVADMVSRVDWSQRYLFGHLLKNAYDFYIYFDTTFKQIHAVLANM